MEREKQIKIYYKGEDELWSHGRCGNLQAGFEGPDLVKLESREDGKPGEWRKVIELEVGEEIAVPVQNLSDVPSYGVHDNGQYTSKSTQMLEMLKHQLLLSFLNPSLSWLDKYAKDETTYSQTYEYDSKDQRKLFKEITGKAHSKNRLTQISYMLSNKFSPRLVYDIHWHLIYHAIRSLSSLFSGQDGNGKRHRTPSPAGLRKGGKVAWLG